MINVHNLKEIITIANVYNLKEIIIIAGLNIYLAQNYPNN